MLRGTMVRTLCAWCGSEIHTEWPQDASPSSGVSHGICIPCAEKLYGELGIPLETFVESIGAPVVVVDADVVVRAANSTVCRIVGKKAADLEGRWGGDVFLCPFAESPEGCGRTVHCSGCAIRMAVSETAATGQPSVGIRASLKRTTCDGCRDVDLIISTRKCGNYVLLSVEETPEERLAC